LTSATLRSVADTRSAADADPIDDPHVVYQATRVLALLDAMGLLELDAPIAKLDLGHLRKAANAAAQAGIGRDVLPLLSTSHPTAGQLGLLVEQLAEALEDSPSPASETGEMSAVFGWQELARLVSASQISLRRYAAGQRDAPDAVAARMHWLAKVVGELRGAYNDAGIRRWFERPRAQLDGRPPRALLRDGWSPDDADVERVRQLAAALFGGGSAT
jgi:hypothetical protein